eukprot:TRINITY_DN8308_c0_g1_i1.p1 TRINITY_DN8308_c0_g1~~TRINITY_DN8308_c0_g1_i1.p1  ORF type:complete len:506 (-),score=62.67 TRINITY_DN8308_c0_g1_i1:62-1579(-)
MEEDLIDWLDELDLLAYAGGLEADGLTRMADIEYVTADILDNVGMTRVERNRFLRVQSNMSSALGKSIIAHEAEVIYLTVQVKCTRTELRAIKDILHALAGDGLFTSVLASSVNSVLGSPIIKGGRFTRATSKKVTGPDKFVCYVETDSECALRIVKAVLMAKQECTSRVVRGTPADGSVLGPAPLDRNDNGKGTSCLDPWTVRYGNVSVALGVNISRVDDVPAHAGTVMHGGQRIEFSFTHCRFDILFLAVSEQVARSQRLSCDFYLLVDPLLKGCEASLVLPVLHQQNLDNLRTEVCLADFVPRENEQVSVKHPVSAKQMAAVTEYFFGNPNYSSVTLTLATHQLIALPVKCPVPSAISDAKKVYEVQRGVCPGPTDMHGALPQADVNHFFNWRQRAPEALRHVRALVHSEVPRVHNIDHLDLSGHQLMVERPVSGNTVLRTDSTVWFLFDVPTCNGRDESDEHQAMLDSWFESVEEDVQNIVPLEAPAEEMSSDGQLAEPAS